MRHGEHLRLAGRGTGGRTQLEIVHEVSDRKSACNNGDRQQAMLEVAHIMARMVLVLDDVLVFRRRYRLRDMAGVEYLIQAVPARVHL